MSCCSSCPRPWCRMLRLESGRSWSGPTSWPLRSPSASPAAPTGRTLSTSRDPRPRRMAEEAARLAATPGVEVIVLDIPLLLDTTDGVDLGLDGIVVADASDDVRVGRLAARDGLSPEEARRRMRAQVPLRDKVARADWVIDNNGSPDRTREQVRAVWEAIRTHPR